MGREASSLPASRLPAGVVGIQSSAGWHHSFMQQIFTEQPTGSRSTLTISSTQPDYSFGLCPSTRGTARVSLASRAKSTEIICRQQPLAREPHLVGKEGKVCWLQRREASQEIKCDHTTSSKPTQNESQTIQIKVSSCYLPFSSKFTL